MEKLRENFKICFFFLIPTAAALGKQKTHGSLEIGKYGDLLILNAPR